MRPSGAGRFITLFILVALPLLLLAGIISATSLQELSLSPQGLVYEVYLDNGGHVWVSDYAASQVWQVNPGGGVYTSYSGLDGVSDAKLDANGDLWWADYGANRLGRLTPGAAGATLWTLGGHNSATGITFDDAGKVWISHVTSPTLQSFDSASSELCTYTFPDTWAAYSSWYAMHHQGEIWLAGYNSLPLGRLFRFDPETGMLTGWGPFGLGSQPMGLAVDDSNHIWWADYGLERIAALNPAMSEITYYGLPATAALADPQPAGAGPGLSRKGSVMSGRTAANSGPVMVAARNGRIWFTDPTSQLVGKLVPPVASGVSQSISTSSQLMTGTCGLLGPGITESVMTRDNLNAGWSNGSFTTLLDQDGWSLYQMPGQSQPWGIAAGLGEVWIAQQNRQQLGWFSYEACYYLLAGHDGAGGDPLAQPGNSDGCGLEQYLAGETITVTASPDPGWGVAGWTGTDNNGAGILTNTVTMPAAEHLVTVTYGQCHTLILGHNGQGSDPVASPAASPGCPAGTFLGGSVITLTAAPEPSWTVTGWSGTGDDGATTLTNTLTMPATDHVAGVTYAQCYALTLSHTGEGGDPIASPAASAGCGMGEFVPGTLITLTASPAFDWSIFGWLGTNDDSSNAEENSLTMPATNHQVAVFYTQCHLLALSHNGEGADPSAEPGNSAGCLAGRYRHETSITLTAAPAADWTLVGWMGSDDDGLKTLTNMLTMPPTSHQVHVDYAQCYSLTLSHTGSGADPVAEPGGSPGCTAGYYLAGTVIGLTAAPEQGWRVSGWNGSDDDEAESVYNQLTMPAVDHIVTVIYSDRQYIFLPLIVRK